MGISLPFLHSIFFLSRTTSCLIQFVWPLTKEDKSCVPECITSKYIIKVVSSRDLIISKMDAFVEDPCEVQMLRKMMPLHSYCFDTEHVFELTVPSLPFL